MQIQNPILNLHGPGQCTLDTEAERPSNPRRCRMALLGGPQG